jgi:hypothetical protein
MGVMSMSEMVDVISSEFEEAMEIKNPKSLHRGIFLLLSSTVPREEHIIEHNDLKSSITALNHNVELIALRMEEGFKRMDERFEAIDRRFQTVVQRFEASDIRFVTLERHFDKRFAMMFTFITIGFVVMATMMSVFQFLG